MVQGKTILIVDDEMSIVDVIQAYLQKADYQVFCAYSGNEALDIFEKHTPDLILLDLMLPDLAGEDVCRIVRKKSRVPIIMLTAKVEEESILKGLEIGADDYITKPFSPRQIVARVNAVLRRTATEAMPIADLFTFNDGDFVIDNLRHEVRINDERVLLTPNEFKILYSLVKYPTKAFTREEIINLALEDGYEGYDRVIDTHIKNIRQKIEKDPKSPQYIKTVHGIGYKFGGDEIEIKP